MALGKKHEIKVDIKNYQHLIIGDKKIGKTGLTAEIAEEIYGDVEKLLIVSLGKEKAYEAIDGAMFEEPKNWKEVIETADEMIRMIKDGEWDFDLVSWDTIDELLPIMEEEVIRLHTISYKEKPKGFNACFGGYNNPKDKVRELVDELMGKMDIVAEKSAIFWVGHNKVRPIKTKLDTEDYYVVSSNLAFDYFNMFAYKTPIICNIIKEVDVTNTGKTEGVGSNKKEISVASKRDRQMYFRDSGAVEAGGRFKTMPEKVDYGAKNYYDTVLKAISDAKKNPSNLEKPKQQKNKATKTAEKKEEILVEGTNVDDAKDIKPLIDKIISLSRELSENGISNKVIMNVYKDNSITNPNEISDYDIAQKAVNELEGLL